jgi:hypothetical protein
VGIIAPSFSKGKELCCCRPEWRQYPRRQAMSAL